MRSEGGSRREGGNTENDIVTRVNIALEADRVAFHVPGGVFHVEIASKSHREGEDFASGHSELFKNPLLKGFVEVIVGMPLDAVVRILEKGVTHNFLGPFLHVDENTDPLPFGRFKDRFEKSGKAELGKLAFFWVKLKGAGFCDVF